MAHILLLFTILSFFAGAVNLLFLSLLYSRNRDPVQKWSILFMLPFTLFMVEFTLLSYFSILALKPDDVFLLVLSVAAGSTMMVILPAYSRVLSDLPPWTGIVRLFAVCAAATVCLALVEGFLGRNLQTSPARIFPILFLSAGILYSAGLGITATVKKGVCRTMNPAQKAALVMAFVTVCGYLPVSIVVALLEKTYPLLGAIPSFQALYLAWNVLLIRGYLSEFRKEPPGTVRREGVEHDPAANPAERCREKFGISSRECDVLGLLLQGKSYQEIGDILCISLATVKTHVNRIYRKTGSSNKVELIRVLEQR